MDRRLALTAIRLGSVVLVLAAIAAQAVELADHGRFDVTRFFAFFTIQSNLIGVAALMWVLFARTRPRSRTLELFRGAAAAYLTVTFFVVIFLLSGVDVQLQLAWVDFVLHKLFPVIVVLDWIVDPPQVRLTLRAALTWLAYPLVWIGLTLARGAADGWHPYPFLDPANGGYGQVVVTIAAITAGFLLLTVGAVEVANRLASRTGQIQPAT